VKEAKEAILAGEIVLLEKDGKPSFSKLAPRCAKRLRGESEAMFKTRSRSGCSPEPRPAPDYSDSAFLVCLVRLLITDHSFFTVESAICYSLLLTAFSLLFCLFN
jgi:hypothetical protein